MNTLVRQNASTTEEHIKGFVDYVEYEWTIFLDMMNTQPFVGNTVIAKKLTFLLDHADCIKSMNDDTLKQMKGLLTTVSRNENDSIVQ